jgi:ABC-2 type transport system ATP-binding protein
MLQRLGLAQALVNDPELVVLDEPMSGLDPLGRKEVRDLIAGLRAEGRTVLFSTHILSDAELLCDRVAIVVGGRMHGVGSLHDLLRPELLHTELLLEVGGVRELRTLPAGQDVQAELRAALAAGHTVVSVTPRREALEDLFVREVLSGSTALGAAPQVASARAAATGGAP